MSRIALIAAAIGLAGCATSTPDAYNGGTMNARDVNCGAGVVSGAVLGGLAGNQIGKGTGQDVATIAGATVGGLLGATRQTCQPQAYGQQPVYAQQPVYSQPAYGQPVYSRSPQPVLVGYDRYGNPVYR
jgi:uncharacterized protein YcfJ